MYEDVKNRLWIINGFPSSLTFTKYPSSQKIMAPRRVTRSSGRGGATPRGGRTGGRGGRGGGRGIENNDNNNDNNNGGNPDF